MTNIIATVSVLAILLLSLACGTKSATESTPVGNVQTSGSTEGTPAEKPPTESVPTQSVSTENGSIAEYARWTCGSDGPEDLPDDATWGDYVEMLEESLDTVEDIVPPAELRDYHNAGVAAAKSALDFAKGKPKGDALNQFEMWGAPEVMVLGMAVVSLQDEFPDEVRDEFIKAGCSGFEEEPGDPGTSWEGREINAEYTRHQDPLTDEVTLFFVIESTEDYGHLVIRANCAGEAQPFIGVQIWTSAGNEDDLLVRFDDDALQEETWIWETVSNAPGMVPESLLTLRQDRAAEFLANVMASGQLAVRYPEKDSIPEKTFIFETTKLQDLWNQEGFKGCE